MVISLSQIKCLNLLPFAPADTGFPGNRIRDAAPLPPELTVRTLTDLRVTMKGDSRKGMVLG